MWNTPPAYARSVTIVVELENAATIDWDDLAASLNALYREIRALSTGLPSDKPEVIFVHGGQPDRSAPLVAGMRDRFPQIAEIADVEWLCVPHGRYYELKNAGLARASGRFIVFLDSDTVPEAGWLGLLLAPFERAETVAVAGWTYLGCNDVISRTLALTWVFPLQHNDDRNARRRPLSANNCAFRADWIQSHPFPVDNGFKVGCTKLVKLLHQSGHELTRVPAFARHAPLSGWRFLAWRALVTGRDADRKYADLKSPARWRRLGNALKFWLKSELRVVRRVCLHSRQVGLPAWQAPLAISLAATFYLLAFCGQAARLAGLAADRPEYVPAFAKHT